MPVHSSRKDDPRYCCNRTRLRGAATRPRRSAWLTWREPFLCSIFETKCRQTSSFDGIEFGAADRPPSSPVFSQTIVNRGVHSSLIAGHAPFHPSKRRTFPYASLPKDSSVLVGIERVDNSRLLARDDKVASRNLNQDG